MKLQRVFQRGFVAASFFREDMQDDGLILILEELKGLDQQRQVASRPAPSTM